MATLNKDIYSAMRDRNKKPILYGKEGDLVTIIFDYDDIKIVEHDTTKEKFSVHKEDLRP